MGFPYNELDMHEQSPELEFEFLNRGLWIQPFICSSFSRNNYDTSCHYRFIYEYSQQITRSQAMLNRTSPKILNVIESKKLKLLREWNSAIVPISITTWLVKWIDQLNDKRNHEMKVWNRATVKKLFENDFRLRMSRRFSRKFGLHSTYLPISTTGYGSSLNSKF